MSSQKKSSETSIKQRIVRVAELEELEELIDLAADVSSNIDRLKRKHVDKLYHMIICLFGLLIVSVFFFYGDEYMKLPAESAGLSPKLAILFSLPFVLYLFKNIVNRARLAKKMYSESLILDDLFNKLHGHRQTVFTHLGSMKKAIIILKLNRIKFSNSTSKRKNTNSIFKKVVDSV